LRPIKIKKITPSSDSRGGLSANISNSYDFPSSRRLSASGKEIRRLEQIANISCFVKEIRGGCVLLWRWGARGYRRVPRAWASRAMGLVTCSRSMSASKPVKGLTCFRPGPAATGRGKRQMVVIDYFLMRRIRSG
jgi:hypothetical protein